MKDCTETTPEEKHSLAKSFTEDKSKRGPSKSTWRQTRNMEEPKEDSISNGKTTGRLKKIELCTTTPSFTIAVMGCVECMDVKGRTDDDSDDIMVWKAFAQRAL